VAGAEIDKGWYAGREGGCAKAQRGWNGQPGGMAKAGGTLPSMAFSLISSRSTGGIEARSASV
jgi:hypothetical protein